MAVGMRVLVCGDRDWFHSGMVYAALDALRAVEPDLEVISGMARGADTHAARWAERNSVPLHAFYADWNRLGKRAGPIRNQQMLAEGDPQIVLAFHDDLENSKGTKDMVERARRARIPVRLIRSSVGPAADPGRS